MGGGGIGKRVFDAISHEDDGDNGDADNDSVDDVDVAVGDDDEEGLGEKEDDDGDGWNTILKFLGRCGRDGEIVARACGVAAGGINNGMSMDSV